ncbi:MAG: GtrA family protein [Rikenella sp.]|nr:GtrA family protein [Rikenella sp.]
MREAITRIADFFYLKPLRRFVPQETFRYAFVGGLNLLFNMVLYWFCFHFVLRKQDTDLFGIAVVSAPILAFLITFVITFFSGFYLARNVAFGRSEVRGGKQLFRYAQVVAVNVAINYFGLKLLIEVCGFYPSPSYAVIQVITTVFSYLAQRYYTFRTHRCS